MIVLSGRDLLLCSHLITKCRILILIEVSKVEI